ncbi:hypothetical protein TcCL_NonESM09935 [Trypanosoma cruzi]|nr:hypothetical protein TcCL_NonESM09935 [Trypanosoma cruzi]
MNALTKMLFSFCLPYRAWRPLEERCDGVDCRAAEEAVAARDVLRIFLRFRTAVEKRTFHASFTSTRVNGGIAVVGSHFTRVCALCVFDPCRSIPLFLFR